VAVHFSNLPGDTLVVAAAPTGTDHQAVELSGGHWQPLQARWGQSLALAIYPHMSTPEAQLTASFNIPQSITAGTPVTYQAQTNNGRLFSWSFGGTARVGRNVTYTFDSAGTYLVVLNVFDGRCYARDTQQLLLPLRPQCFTFFAAVTNLWCLS